MAASWPSAKKTFSQVVNGITKLVQLLFNVGYDEIEAMQTWIGPPGTTQAKNASMMALFKTMFRPLPKVTWIDAATVEIAAGEVVMFSGNNYVIKENAAAIQIVLPTNLDTGAEAASTWYDVFLIGDGADSAFTAKFVVQGNTPSGAIYYKKIFSVRNDGSSNILKFFQQGNIVMWDVPISITTSVSAGSWSSALSCAAAMPAISRLGIFGLRAEGDSGNDNALVSIRPNGSTWGTGLENGIYVRTAGTTNKVAGQRMCMTDATQQIQYYNYSDVDATAISVEGYMIDLQ